MKRSIYVLWLLIIGWGYTDAQHIRGVVKDMEGNPLPFAHVVVPVTGYGVVTNIDGEFSLSITGNRKVIRISYVGYKTKTIELHKNLEWLEIKLAENPSLLEEIVVVGTKSYVPKVKAVLDSVLAHFPQNHPVRPRKMLVDFRQLNTVGDRFSRLIEARLSMFDSGHPKSIDIDYCILGYKTSQDLRQFTPKEIAIASEMKRAENSVFYFLRGANSGPASEPPMEVYDSTFYPLERMFFFNNLRTASVPVPFPVYFGFFNKDFVRTHKFELLEVTDDLVKIKISHAKNSPGVPIGNNTNSNFFIPFGEMWVDPGDWGILYFNYGYKVNPRYKNKPAYDFEVYNGDILFESYLVFEKNGGSYQLKYHRLMEKDRALKGKIVTLNNNKKRESFLHTKIIREIMVLGDSTLPANCHDNIYKNENIPFNIEEKDWNLPVIKLRPINSEIETNY